MFKKQFMRVSHVRIQSRFFLLPCEKSHTTLYFLSELKEKAEKLAEQKKKP